MARKTAMWPVTDEGRDNGKLFLITEMSAARAESWAMRVLLALMVGNTNVPEGFEELGMAGLAELGLKALSGLKWEVAEPLLGEMMDCIQIIPDPRKTHVVRLLIESDIEEVTTRFKLKAEVLKLHTDFFTSAAPSIFPAKRDTVAADRVSHTRTSRK
jgi:hypothetical protein